MQENNGYFIKDWVRTTLIWVGLILFWGINLIPTGYGEPYLAVIDGVEYIIQDPLTPEYFWFIFPLAIAFTMTGCYIWTRLKNRSWVFSLWGLLSPIGLLGISLLRDKTDHS